MASIVPIKYDFVDNYNKPESLILSSLKIEVHVWVCSQNKNIAGDTACLIVTSRVIFNAFRSVSLKLQSLIL